ncbi:MAG: hypothetical protein GX616_10250 [Planctomycetes bacterium]|nr:hypothetical protein [Planctomycetota bacterium]
MPSRVAGRDAGIARTSKITITSTVNTRTQGEGHRIDAYTEVYYTWRRKGLEHVLSVDSLLVKARINGEESMNTFMSRAKLVNTEQGQTQEVSFDEASDELKKTPRDSFDVPLCILQVDASGKETRRTVVAGAGAKSMVDNGMIANALLFHPPFPPQRKEWQADAEFSTGNGGSAQGKLTYTTVPGRGPRRLFKVSGKCSRESFRLPDKPLTMKDVLFVVSGEQTYDPAQRAWVSGKLAVDVSFQMITDDQTTTSAKGKMTLSCEESPGRQTTRPSNR